MKKIKITLIKIGHLDHLINFNKISKWQSKIFDIIEIQNIEHLSKENIACSVNDGFLDLKYEKKDMANLIKNVSSDTDLAIAIMPYRFVDNHYMHKEDKRAVISLYGIKEILNIDNISLENFIVRQLYKLCARKEFPNCKNHQDTRGCFYDMNGNRKDILLNTEQPKICEKCKDNIKSQQDSQNRLRDYERELKKIKKPLFLKFELYVKKYPLFSILMSAILGAIISIAISELFKLVKFLIVNYAN